MRRFSLLLPAITGALAVSCADSKSPTAPTTLQQLPTNHSAHSVERSTVPFGFAFDDGRQIFFLGLTFEDLVSIFCTGAPFDVDEVNQLEVIRPDGSQKLQLKGNVNVVVVNLAAFNQSFCQEPSAVPTYTGTARLILNDSDFDLSGPGADAAQMHLVGTVTDQNGQRYHVVGINQSVVAARVHLRG